MISAKTLNGRNTERRIHLQRHLLQPVVMQQLILQLTFLEPVITRGRNNAFPPFNDRHISARKGSFYVVPFRWIGTFLDVGKLWFSWKGKYCFGKDISAPLK